MKQYSTLLFFTLLAGCSMISGEHFFREDGLVTKPEDLKDLFPTSVDGIKKYAQRTIDFAKSSLQEIVDLKVERDFKNTAQTLDETSRRFDIARSVLYLMEMVHTDAPMRDKAREEFVRMHGVAVDIFASRDLYKAFKEYVDFVPEKSDLSSEEKYFLKKQMRDFELLGLQLPDIDFEAVKSMRKKLSELQSVFSRNIAAAVATQKMNVIKPALRGVSEEAIAGFERAEDGRYIVGVDYPTRAEIMGHCSVSSTRKEFGTLFENCAFPENDILLKEVASIRDKMAELLGYMSFAELNLVAQMAKNPKTVGNFLDELFDGVEKKSKEERNRLTQDLPKGVELDKSGKLKAWDVDFVKNEYKKKKFNLDDREIAKYFPVEHSLEKIFEIYQSFLGLQFSIIKDAFVWHEDVKLIQIKDKQSGFLHGYLYLDLYPRPFKFSHACFMSIVTPVDRAIVGGELSYPSVSAVIANFPKATKDKPALMKHGDVTTFFHEFGHAMHGLLGRTEMNSFSGTNVKRDFVEMPSQMFEEWLWDKNILKDVSKHYQTGEKLPDDLIDKKIALKKFDSGFFVTRQAWLSFIALDCFLQGEQKDTNEIIKNLHEKYIKNIAFNPESHFQSSFSHLIGYGAKYYGYMWSRVFALDMFDKVK
ncbi:Zn-dependent oligopeptidase, partial [Candidatus Babeliales bacterium]|nr:Zn-dependent oligopeptidase [Candidatus Babeliales bacterium]